MVRSRRLVALALLLAGCAPQKAANHVTLPELSQTSELAPPVIRQPVLPEMLVPCRGHVLVPALGMTFVAKGGTPPENGQYLREERVNPPYRIITPGARLSAELNPGRLNIELDKARRIVGLYCG